MSFMRSRELLAEGDNIGFHCISGLGVGGVAHTSDLTYLTFSLPAASTYNWKTGQVMWSSQASVDDHSVHLSQHFCSSFLACVISLLFISQSLSACSFSQHTSKSSQLSFRWLPCSRHCPNPSYHLQSTHSGCSINGCSNLSSLFIVGLLSLPVL